jgi:hypothetical protein
MPSILPPNFTGFNDPTKQPVPKQPLPNTFPTKARIVSHEGDLKVGDALSKGTHVVWLYAPNASWIPVLQWVAKWNTAWNAFTGIIQAAHNATNALKVSFPASQKIAGKWVQRKGYDAVKRGLYFLVNFK